MTTSLSVIDMAENLPVTEGAEFMNIRCLRGDASYVTVERIAEEIKSAVLYAKEHGPISEESLEALWDGKTLDAIKELNKL